MEEVDAILLSQLREIGCDLDDDIAGISSLDSIQVMKCVAECLARILTDPIDTEHLPKVNQISESMNMSVRYKYATTLSTSIQDLGYKSEIGYQTFMYGNEHEIRRLLLFLIERIPRDDEKTSETREGDQLSSGSITQKLKNLNINTIWIPYSNDDDDGEEAVDEELKYSAQSDLHDHYNSVPLNANAIHTGADVGFRVNTFLSKSHSKPLQRYAKYKLSSSTASSQNLLLPQSVADIMQWNSLNCRSAQFDDEDSADPLDVYISRCRANNKNAIQFTAGHLSSAISLDESGAIPLQTDAEPKTVESTLSQATEETVKELTKEEKYAQSIEKLRERIREYDQQIAEFNEKQDLVTRCESEYQEKCKQFEASYKSKEELEKGVATIKMQIEEIASTWEQIQKDLLEEIKLKKSQSLAQNEDYREKMKRIVYLKKSIAAKLKEIQSKESLVAELTAKKPDEWPPGRASYTRRIIEIIGNVKKQNDETKKVLLETKTIQKDINTLNGKIERSFAVSEDIIYREAKLNEWNRKCYKQLALLHTTFDQLLEAVFSVGVHLREIRNLEEMVDNERARKASSNLTRINADLQQIKLENQQLKGKTRQQ